MKKAIFCWSGGKDSAFALYQVLKEKEYSVELLFTTVNENFKRVSMHGVREELIERQAKSIGIPWLKMYVREGSNVEYERNMETFLKEQKAKGIEYVIFGDIFLEDLRQYRETNLAKAGMKAVFPLWKKDTKQLANDFIKTGFKTILCCTNDAYLGEKEVGELYTADFVNHLPPNVDPCGEHGEFHSFCFDGPIFKEPVKFEKGEKVYKPIEIKVSKDHPPITGPRASGFWFCELSL
ncbi:MAG TPA: diphthine--ammonia ligase [Bacteroidia bacterium]|nr:diphthine--ammonia ligase [Bacteroidia bacterium]